MKIELIDEAMNGAVKVLRPEVFEDERGFFMEVYRTDQMEALGIPGPFVQDNHSRSLRGVLRGLHFQWDPPMGKVMRVTLGEAFLVAVDIRIGSPTLGSWHGRRVSAANKEQVWAPAGFARGFCVLSDVVELQYKVTGVYNGAAEAGIRWNDPDIGIDWPIANPQLSARDVEMPCLQDWLLRPEAKHFQYS